VFFLCVCVKYWRVRFGMSLGVRNESNRVYVRLISYVLMRTRSYECMSHCCCLSFIDVFNVRGCLGANCLVIGAGCCMVGGVVCS
jgi:hypothetical protein